MEITRITLRLPKLIADRLKLKAIKDHRSLNGTITQACEAHIKGGK